MPRRPPSIRQKRVAQQVQHELSDLLMQTLNDPRLELTTITDVKVDRELEFANIWVCSLDGQSERQAEIMTGLDNASGFMRRELAARLQLRRMPQLIFHWDYLPERAARIDEVIDSLHTTDETSDTTSNATGETNP